MSDSVKPITKPFQSLLQGIKTFTKSVVRSFTDLHYFVDVLNAPIRFSFKIVLAFYLLLGVILTSSFSFTYLPALQRFTTDIVNAIDQQIPTGMELNWENNLLQSNLEEPVIISFSQSQELPMSSGQVRHVLIFDQTATHPPKEKDTFIFVSGTTLYLNSQGVWSDLPLAVFFTEGDQYISNDQIFNTVASWKSSLTSGYRIMPLILFAIFGLGLFVSRIFMIAMNTIIAHFFFTLLGKPVPYTKVFQLSLHLLIPSEVITQVAQLLYPQLEFSMMSASYWSLMLLITWHMRNLQVLTFQKKEEKK